MKKVAFLLLLPIFWSCKNSQSSKSPLIKHLEWGKIIVEENNGQEISYRDCKVYPNTSIEWDWRKTGTRHVPGIQITDIEEFINKVDYVVLSKGMDEILQTKQETVKYLEDLKHQGKIKNYYILQTEQAVKKYNDLVQKGKKVGGVFHSTC